MSAETICGLWRRSVAKPPPGPAFLVQDSGAWHEVGWPEAALAVDELAAGFHALGLRKGDRVAILARTRLEWTYVDYALLSLGAISVPIYPTSSPADCAYILADSAARAIVCEDTAQVARIGPAREALEHVVVIDGEVPGALRLEEVAARGREALAGEPLLVERARDAVVGSDVLTFIYTSGTTGVPKGCVVTQRNYAALVEMVREIEGLISEGDVVLLFLPLAHTFARTVEFVATTLGTIAFCPDVAAIPGALRAVRPTVLPSSPRLFERMYAAVTAGFEREAGVRLHLIEWALRVGGRASRLRREGTRVPRRLAVQVALADRLVFSKVQERLGGRLRHAISGGAALSAEVAEFFHALGILVLEGYGLTECSVVSVNRPAHYKFGTVGPPLPGVEVRLAEDGELLVRAENVFQGYHGKPEETSAVLPGDGWLRTGDVAEIDADGFITITDRKKDIIVLAGGKNVAPQKIEAALTASPYVSQALVVGDNRPFVTALLAPDRERATGSDEEVRGLVERAVADANRSLGRDERVRRFAVLEREFAQEAGEVTPTLKLKRKVCEGHFADEIERLYAGPTKEAPEA